MSSLSNFIHTIPPRFYTLYSMFLHLYRVYWLYLDYMCHILFIYQKKVLKAYLGKEKAEL